MEIFARLPNELVREVFAHAAASDTQSALALARVASWTQQLVEPLLYHTVVLPTARAVTAFAATLAAKPPAFAPAHVRHLGVLALGPLDAVDAALDACRGVASLACGFSLPAFRAARGCAAVRALARPTEQHLLGLACRDGWDAALVAPSVSHLRIHLSSDQTARLAALARADALVRADTDGGDDADAEDARGDAEDLGWGALAALPALTHLAVVFAPSAACPATTILTPILALLAQSQPHTGPAPPHAHPGPAAAAAAPHLQTDPAPQTAADAAPPHPHASPTPPPTANAQHSDARAQHALVLVQVAGSAATQAAAVAALNGAACARGGDALRVVAEPAPGSAVAQWERAVRGGGEEGGVWARAEGVVAARLAQREKEKARRAAPQALPAQ